VIARLLVIHLLICGFGFIVVPVVVLLVLFVVTTHTHVHPHCSRCGTMYRSDGALLPGGMRTKRPNTGGRDRAATTSYP
jgi:hypothetical protein